LTGRSIFTVHTPAHEYRQKTDETRIKDDQKVKTDKPARPPTGAEKKETTPITALVTIDTQGRQEDSIMYTPGNVGTPMKDMQFRYVYRII
jgi:hypothetical protein